MGNNHSTQRYTRRRSLVKDEFEFPEPSWDYFHDWEIYHVDIELDVLPPGVRHNIYVRLDSYTQEIIEDECPREVNPLSPETEERKSRDDDGSESSAKRRSSCGDVEGAKQFYDGRRVPRCVLKRGVCFVDGEFSNEFSQNLQRSRDVRQQGEDEVLVGGDLSSLENSNAEAGTESEFVGLPMSNDMFLQWEMSLEENHAPATALPNRDCEVFESRSTQTDCDDLEARPRDRRKTLETPRDGDSEVMFQPCLGKHETDGTHRDSESTRKVPRDFGGFFPTQPCLQDDEDSSASNVSTNSYEQDDRSVLEALTKSYVSNNEGLSVKMKAVTERCALRDNSCALDGPTGNRRIEEDADVFDTSTRGNESRCLGANRVSSRSLGRRSTGAVDLSEKDGPFSQSESDADDVFSSSATVGLQERNAGTSRTGAEPVDAHHQQFEASETSMPKPGPATSRAQRSKTCSLSQVTTSMERDRTQKNVAASKKSRKYSLKDDPGWIPNPLDSDYSEDDEMNDSGVFSDAASSPVFTGSRGGSITAVSTGSSKPGNSPGGTHNSKATAGGFVAHAATERSKITADDTRACGGPHQPVTGLDTTRTTSLPEQRDDNDKKQPLSAAHIARKRLALQLGRRRHNSEPTPVSPGSDDKRDGEGRRLLPQGDVSAAPRPSSLTDDKADKPRWESKWRLVRLMWGRKKKPKQPEEAPAIPPEPRRGDLKPDGVAAVAEEEDEVDLDEQLAWMTRPTDSENASQAGTEPPSPSDADPDAVDFSNAARAGTDSQSRRHNEATASSKSDPRTKKEVAFSSSDLIVGGDQWPNHHQPSPGHGGEARRSQKHPLVAVEPELELDWLCEPEWNNFELELFWSVLRPHMEKLLAGGEEGGLLDPCVAVCSMDAGDHKMLDRCLLHVQWHIWKGNYRQAVADFRAVRRHFRCCAESNLIESETRDDVESLRLVFQRKRPSRFRFWI